MDKLKQRGAENAPGTEFLQFAFDHLGDGIFWLDPDGCVIYANEAACRSLECSSDEILNYRVPDFAPDFSDADWRSHWLEIKSRQSFSIETRHRSRSGRIFPVEVTVNYFDHGGREFNCAIVRDISVRKGIEDSMRLATAIYISSNEAVLVTDEDNCIVQLNPAFTRITGYSLDDLRGKDPRILQSGLQSEETYRNMWQDITGKGYWQGELCDRRKNGDLITCWVTITQLKHQDGSLYRHVAQFTDITEKKIQEELVWRQANYDELTGLPNRRLFFDRFEQEVKKANRAGGVMALMFIDLDGFKQVNDNFGHDEGDCLLIEVARRISKCVRETDTVARLGGDEFTIILPEAGERAYADRIVESVLSELGIPVELQEGGATVSASIGVAFYPADAQDTVGLVKRADRAMYLAKGRGRNCCVYASELA